MITFISNSGEICPIAQRMQKEGERVQIYTHHPAYDRSFDNILSKVKLRDLPAAARKSDLVIFDHVRPNVGLKRDHALLRLFNCDVKSPSVFGVIAEKIRKRNVRVIGTSKATEQLELDRMFGSQIAKKAGFSIPVTYDFDKLSEAQRFLEGKKSRWVLKPHNNASLDLTYVEKYPGELEYRLRNDIRTRVGTDNFPCMLQKYIDGIALSTEGWFNGQEFVSFNHTYEEKSFMAGNLGPHVGSQSNTVWTRQEEIYPEIIIKLQKLQPLLKEAEYIGPIDVNCIIAEKNEHPYFLEWTPRFGYDALFALLSTCKTSLSDLFRTLEPQFDERLIACSQRISIPPYPYEIEEELKKAESIEIRENPDLKNFWFQDIRLENGLLQCAGADGIIGVAVGTGFSIGEAANNAYNVCENIKIGSYKQYRVDMKKNAYKVAEKIGLRQGGNSNINS